ncbi:3-hydroxybutyrate dehydrogenase [Bacillus lacus]|uniref:3-hydroxybutyrate dehydrogenase n=1 Tax=Metabacillus lacus TaxID=1983721 RepID=A0A7X2M0D1_9BACI|nr:3-hydroxybutyrate dehydrogenase [Metabacillus lacus]MRX73958.1 3-hydroxybutyrate dehydrogenase [Metabacillus lacus]
MVRDKTVFITGAAQGIGLEIAKAFGKEGANVFLTDINEEKAVESADMLSETGIKAAGYKCDVTSEESLKSAINTAVEQFGTIHILINNAGMQHVAYLEDFPVKTFELLTRIMLIGPFIATKLIFPIFKEQSFGRIINVASINGLVGFAGKSAYNSAKHGVIGLTKVAALEGAEHGITVNALCPGYVDTPLVRNQLADLAKTRNVSMDSVIEEVIYPLVPQKRLLDVSEVAEYALFLASSSARGITGQAAVIDGGYTVQ